MIPQRPHHASRPSIHRPDRFALIIVASIGALLSSCEGRAREPGNRGVGPPELALLRADAIWVAVQSPASGWRVSEPGGPFGNTYEAPVDARGRYGVAVVYASPGADETVLAIHQNTKEETPELKLWSRTTTISVDAIGLASDALSISFTSTQDGVAVTAGDPATELRASVGRQDILAVAFGPDDTRTLIIQRDVEIPEEGRSLTFDFSTATPMTQEIWPTPDSFFSFINLQTEREGSVNLGASSMSATTTWSRPAAGSSGDVLRYFSMSTELMATQQNHHPGHHPTR